MRVCAFVQTGPSLTARPCILLNLQGGSLLLKQWSQGGGHRVQQLPTMLGRLLQAALYSSWLTMLAISCTTARPAYQDTRHDAHDQGKDATDDHVRKVWRFCTVCRQGTAPRVHGPGWAGGVGWGHPSMCFWDAALWH